MSAKPTNRVTVDDHPAFEAASNKLAELQRLKNALETKLADLRSRPKTDRISMEAEALLTGKPVPAETESADDVSRQLEIVKRAIELQAEVVNECRRVAQAFVKKAFSGERKNIIDVMADAVRALKTATERYIALMSSIEDAGVPREAYAYAAFAPVGIDPHYLCDAMATWLESHRAGALYE